MIVVSIVDKKGNVPVYSAVVPSVDTFARELKIGAKTDTNSPFVHFPEDYLLVGLEWIDDDFEEFSRIPFNEIFRSPDSEPKSVKGD